MVIGVLLVGLWIQVQKIPERLFPESPFVHKFLSSDIIKCGVVVWALMTVHFLLKDAMVLKDNHGQIIQQHQVTHTAAAPSIALHSLVTKAVEKPSVEQQLDSSKKKLHDAEMQLQKLKANIASKPTPPAVAHLSPTVKKA